ncbi:hypothetical protein, partial [Flavobacterium psychrophilum]|uniref:hypothetical protein n=1 Tax=Flavobacterium psychrophilum TaxID=96345 RepID=UPI003390AD7C
FERACSRRKSSKAGDGRTSCESNDGFPSSPRYKQFGTKLSPIFGFAKSSKYKTNFKLSLIPKLLVACVGGCNYSSSVTFLNLI